MKKPKPQITAEQKELEKLQTEELRSQKSEKGEMRALLQRPGRRSLLATSERGVT